VLEFDGSERPAAVGRMLVYASLAFVLAVATVLSMVRKAKLVADDEADESTPISLAPSEDKH